MCVSVSQSSYKALYSDTNKDRGCHEKPWWSMHTDIHTSDDPAPRNPAVNNPPLFYLSTQRSKSMSHTTRDTLQPEFTLIHSETNSSQ